MEWLDTLGRFFLTFAVGFIATAVYRLIRRVERIEQQLKEK